MRLDKENMKKMMGLIVFTILILVGLQNFDKVLGIVGYYGRVSFRLCWEQRWYLF